MEETWPPSKGFSLLADAWCLVESYPAAMPFCQLLTASAKSFVHLWKSSWNRRQIRWKRDPVWRKRDMKTIRFVTKSQVGKISTIKNGRDLIVVLYFSTSGSCTLSERFPHTINVPSARFKNELHPKSFTYGNFIAPDMRCRRNFSPKTYSYQKDY